MSFVGRLMAERQSGREDGNYDNSLLAIDLLKIDNRSRIPLTKEVKDILPFKPGDTIAIYQDRMNSDLILKVQRGSVLVDALRITKEGRKLIVKKPKSKKIPAIYLIRLMILLFLIIILTIHKEDTFQISF